MCIHLQCNYDDVQLNSNKTILFNLSDSLTVLIASIIEDGDKI